MNVVKINVTTKERIVLLENVDYRSARRWQDIFLDEIYEANRYDDYVIAITNNNNKKRF